jgi:SsrA-binding protein
MAKTKNATGTKTKKDEGGDGTLVVNRRAGYDYFIEDRYEAGMALTGTEIKSLRAGHANLREAYARIDGDEAWLWNAHISPYEGGNRFNHEPTRRRKLLLHRRQIAQLAGIVKRQGYTLVPLRIYIRNNRAKVEIGVARGKKAYDKRDTMAERDAKREVERALAERRRG